MRMNISTEEKGLCCMIENSHCEHQVRLQGIFWDIHVTVETEKRLPPKKTLRPSMPTKTELHSRGSVQGMLSGQCQATEFTVPETSWMNQRCCASQGVSQSQEGLPGWWLAPVIRPSSPDSCHFKQVQLCSLRVKQVSAEEFQDTTQHIASHHEINSKFLYRHSAYCFYKWMCLFVIYQRWAYYLKNFYDKYFIKSKYTCILKIFWIFSTPQVSGFWHDGTVFSLKVYMCPWALVT